MWHYALLQHFMLSGQTLQMNSHTAETAVLNAFGFIKKQISQTLNSDSEWVIFKAVLGNNKDSKQQQTVRKCTNEILEIANFFNIC